jgi:23S rRNA U2552 (ribose-2'-O)-methylase RlmE/FtsJ
MFAPIIAKLPKLTKEYIKSIEKAEDEVMIGEQKTVPSMALGFNYHHHIVRNYLKEREVLQFEKRYDHMKDIVNPFRVSIKDVEKDIKGSGIKKFGSNFGANPNVYSILEIFYYLGNIDTTSKQFKSLYISGDNTAKKIGKEYHPTYYFRKGYAKNDKYDTIDNSEITKKSKDTYDIVMCDNMMKILDYNNEEQDFFTGLLKQVIYGIKNQKKGGSMILQIYDMFTYPTVKLITLLQVFYDDVYIIKPFTSNVMSLNKYIVGVGFKQNGLLLQLEKILVDSGGEDINDIFVNLSIPERHKKIFLFVNPLLTSSNIGSINNYYGFIKKNNYFGDQYKNFKDDQIKWNNYWISIFYEDYKKVSSKLQKVVKEKILATDKKSGIENP